jgi:hypothetical protein
MELNDVLSKRKKVIRGTIGVCVEDPNYGSVYLKVAFEIVTFSAGIDLLAFNAEGIVGSFPIASGLDGDRTFARLKDEVNKAYRVDCAS